MNRFLVVGLLGLVAACYGQPGGIAGSGADPARIEQVAILPGSVESVSADAVQVLSDLGLQPVESVPNGFSGPAGGTRAWAYCPPKRVRDRERTISIQPSSAVVELVLIATQNADGTRVQIVPNFVGTYYHRGRASYFEAPCSSFGVLERTFFEQLRARTGSTSPVAPTS